MFNLWLNWISCTTQSSQWKPAKAPMEQVKSKKSNSKKRKGQRLEWSVQLEIAAMRKLIELFKLAHVQWDYFLGVRTRVNNEGRPWTWCVGARVTQRIIKNWKRRRRKMNDKVKCKCFRIDKQCRAARGRVGTTTDTHLDAQEAEDVTTRKTRRMNAGLQTNRTLQGSRCWGGDSGSGGGCSCRVCAARWTLRSCKQKFQYYTSNMFALIRYNWIRFRLTCCCHVESFLWITCSSGCRSRWGGRWTAEIDCLYGRTHYAHELYVFLIVVAVVQVHNEMRVVGTGIGVVVVAGAIVAACCTLLRHDLSDFAQQKHTHPTWRLHNASK